jgi:AAA domain
MPVRVVDLEGSIVMVPGASLDEAWRRKAIDHPRLPSDIARVEGDLAAMNARGGVPAAVDTAKNTDKNPSLLLYGRDYVLRLFPSPRRDAYVIASVDPLRLVDHHRLATGFLRLHPAGWAAAAELRQVPHGSDSNWLRIQAAWADAVHPPAGQPGTPGPTAEQAAFLDTLDRLIDADEKITTDSAVLGFDEPEDGDRAPQRELEPDPGRRYAMQRDAVARLRRSQSRNPRLLSVLVDHRVALIPPTPDQATPDQAPPDQAAADQAPAELDEDQAEAFRKALTVEDMLAVLGPPGTGKTRTISQIAGACALGAAGRDPARVLVTAQTDAAVDGVLAGLPNELLTIRLGDACGATADGRPHQLERRAAELHAKIIEGTGRALPAHRSVAIAQRWAAELADRAGQLRLAVAAEQRARVGLEAARRAAGGPAQARVDALSAEYEERERALATGDRRAGRLTRCSEGARQRAAWPVVGVASAALARRWDQRLVACLEDAERVRTRQERNLAELVNAQRELDAVTRAHPAVRAARADVQEAARRRAECLAAALAAARSCTDAVAAVDAPPPVTDDHDQAQTERTLAQVQSWLAQRLPVLAARAELLAGWHAQVSGDAEQLCPELIRYADVVAATQAGATSRPGLAGAEFDLAIVEDAGRIGVADALVPLVRARRGVLVGDPQQIPPYSGCDVRAWGSEVGDPALRDLLAKTALELLAAGLPRANVVRLTCQRRIPAAIADFISAEFYDRGIRTAAPCEHRDLLFDSPMAFVNTAQLPAGVRYEKSGRERERWGQPGYTNRAEAELLTELAAWYHRQGADWAVIVPYRAQAAKIAAALTERLGDAELAGRSVGTVDSFRDEYRDVILYGFTRSNRDGRIGFLADLRRANVAFTRARQQLVIVGNRTSLTRVRDRGFRELAESLLRYVAERGDIRGCRDVADRLAAVSVPAGEA